MNITPIASFALIRAIAALDFKPMTESDFHAFAGAAAGSLIAYPGEDFCHALCDATGESIMTEEGMVAVVCSGDNIEVSAMTPDGGVAGLNINLSAIG